MPRLRPIKSVLSAAVVLCSLPFRAGVSESTEIPLGAASAWRVTSEGTEDNLVARGLHLGWSKHTAPSMADWRVWQDWNRDDERSWRQGNGISMEFDELLERFCGAPKPPSAGGDDRNVVMSDDSSAPKPTPTSSDAAAQPKRSDILLCVEADNCVAKHLEQRCKLRGLKHAHFGPFGAKERVLAISQGSLPHCLVGPSILGLPGSMPSSSYILARNAHGGSNTRAPVTYKVYAMVGDRSSAVHVTVTWSPDAVESWLQKHVIRTNATTLGLDLEWKPCFRASRFLVAFRPPTIPPLLRSVLCDPSIRKVGVGIEGDAQRLNQDWGCDVVGRVDVAELADAAGLPHLTSLSKVAGAVLGIKMCKARQVRMGDWEAKPLSPQQALYAALDAWLAEQALRPSAEARRRWYAVTVGRTTGVFENRTAARAQIIDFPGGRVSKGFKTKALAEMQLMSALEIEGRAAGWLPTQEPSRGNEGAERTSKRELGRRKGRRKEVGGKTGGRSVAVKPL